MNTLFAVTREQIFDVRGRILYAEFQAHDLRSDTDIEIDRGFAHLNSEAVYDDNHNWLSHLFIWDFKVIAQMRDKGFGSIILKLFIDYANTLKSIFISGELSFMDIGNESNRTSEQILNRERLYHFYGAKHKFIIDKNEKIRLQLNQT
jgi:hypothetical protein